MGILSFFKKNNTGNINANKLSITDHTNSVEMPPEADFVKERQEEGIGMKSALVEYAALKRGHKVDRLSEKIIIVHTNYGHTFAFTQMNGISSSRIGKYLCDRKHDARYILKGKDISVVESEVFGFYEYNQAVSYINKIGFPVVVKPTNMSRGKGITTNIKSIDEFQTAWEKGFNAYKSNRKAKQLLIERHVNGDDFRLFVVGNKVVSATHRKRANVVGNGQSTVLQLIQLKNEERAENPYLSNYLIPEEHEQLDLLVKKEITLDYVPGKGEHVILRSQSNLSAGGDSVDVTDVAHPEFLSMAVKAVAAIPGVEYGGVDVITPDISAKPDIDNHIISEIEYSPAPLAHFPYKGKNRDMAGAVIDHYLLKNKTKL
ncbi:hypothetical protein [Evansella clarkii]|uniref:ATP-binding protein n=1 Tax=Evansella clarkii TaxID=79879 RepID=UPI0009984C35|nr:hypothetical protein [Evansella clarkii]